jgi:NADH:ubiquinone oxidoreductase subunit C
MLFLKKLAPNFIKKSRIVNSVIEIKTTINNIKKLSLILSWHKLAQYKVLTDVASYDTPGKHLRFSIIYNLLSIQFNSRLRIYSQLDESIPIPTISTIFLSSASLEREA